MSLPHALTLAGEEAHQDCTRPALLLIRLEVELLQRLLSQVPEELHATFLGLFI